MTWEAYQKERYRRMCANEGYMPGRKEVIRKILRNGATMKVSEILIPFCKKTGIDRDSAEANIHISLNKLVERGIIVQGDSGYYRLKK